MDNLFFYLLFFVFFDIIRNMEKEKQLEELFSRVLSLGDRL